MAKSKKRIVISFDYDHDRNYRYLLSALKENPRSDIDFVDLTPNEIQTSDISRIKQVLTTKIRESTHMLVIVGHHANDRHRNASVIGERNWQWWEIVQAKNDRKKLIAVKIEQSCVAPDPLYNSGVKWATFKVESILNAIDES